MANRRNRRARKILEEFCAVNLVPPLFLLPSYLHFPYSSEQISLFLIPAGNTLLFPYIPLILMTRTFLASLPPHWNSSRDSVPSPISKSRYFPLSFLEDSPHLSFIRHIHSGVELIEEISITPLLFE